MKTVSTLKTALAGLRPESEPVPKRFTTALTGAKPVPGAVIARGAKLAKSVDPEWERRTVYVRTETRKRAERKWEDARGGDFSDLVEELLERYLNA
jgi:hypothetical protein